MTKLINYDIIRAEIRRLVNQLPEQERASWLPKKYNFHPHLRDRIFAFLKDNHDIHLTTKQITNAMTQEFSSPISTGDILYHLNKLTAHNEIFKTHDLKGHTAWQVKQILHMTCTDPANKEVARNYTDGKHKYRLRMDIFGQTQWVMANPVNRTWQRAPHNIRFIIE